MIQMEVSSHVDEVTGDLLVDMMTAQITRVLSKSFQDRSETCSIMGNIIDIALARSIEREHFEDLISEGLTRIEYTDGTIHIMTNNILQTQEFTHQSV